MKLIFGQGNPGPQYAATRHNLGFMVLDVMAHQQAAAFSSQSKFQADIAEAVYEGEKILLVKPASFYNETGQVARALIDFYKLDPTHELLVIHDELALPFGTIKFRLDGSDAGNNGVKSLNRHLGTQYARLRLGIANPMREHINDADFVLGKFTRDEQTQLAIILPRAQALAGEFIKDALEPTKITLPGTLDKTPPYPYSTKSP